MTPDEVKEKLFSNKSADRRAAAKTINKEKIVASGKDLYEAYIREKEDKRTWETQSEMIKALGTIGYKPALADMEKIVQENIPHDMITISAALTFVQLKRKDISDAQPVLELLHFGSTSVINGALKALAVDKMMPSKNEIELLLKKGWDINKHKDRIGHEYGLIDPRLYLAIACAGWDPVLTTDFLNHCIETAFNINRFGKEVENTQLSDACKKALKGKYANF